MAKDVEIPTIHTLEMAKRLESCRGNFQGHRESLESLTKSQVRMMEMAFIVYMVHGNAVFLLTGEQWNPWELQLFDPHTLADGNGSYLIGRTKMRRFLDL